MTKNYTIYDVQEDGEKTCTICGDSKSVDNFYKNRHCKTGRVDQCIKCVLERQKSGPHSRLKKCSVAGCERPHLSKGVCHLHYYRMRHPNWKARSPDGHLNSEGYRLIYRPKHPNAKKNGGIFEHRYVMSETLGRPLTKDEVVHHKNKF